MLYIVIVIVKFTCFLYSVSFLFFISCILCVMDQNCHKYNTYYYNTVNIYFSLDFKVTFWSKLHVVMLYFEKTRVEDEFSNEVPSRSTESSLTLEVSGGARTVAMIAPSTDVQPPGGRRLDKSL